MTRQLAYSPQEAAAATSLSHDVIEKAVRAGELPAKRRGRRILIPAGDLERWLDGLEDY